MKNIMSKIKRIVTGINKKLDTLEEEKISEPEQILLHSNTKEYQNLGTTLNGLLYT